MAGTSPCTPCCSETQTVNVPGVEGDPGADAQNGLDAYSITVSDFIIPAIGSTVSVSMQNALWMVVGQIVVFAGPATFLVVSVDSSTSATLEFLGYNGDLAAGVTIAAGAGVSPSGAQPALTSQTVIAAGTPPSLTNSSAYLDFTGGGSVDPTITVTDTGTYLVLARARFDYVGATYSTTHNEITLTLRRTNNTPADLCASGAPTDISITTLSYIAADIQTPPLIYAATAGDVIRLYGMVSTTPSAGAIKATEATIVLVKLS